MPSFFSITAGHTNHYCWSEFKKTCETLWQFNGSDMGSLKIFSVLLLTTIIGTVVARPGHGGYFRHSVPISYTSYPSYSYPSYSYPSYGYGHGLYSSYSYPLYGYGYGGHGLGGWLGDYW